MCGRCEPNARRSRRSLIACAVSCRVVSTSSTRELQRAEEPPHRRVLRRWWSRLPPRQLARHTAAPGQAAGPRTIEPVDPDPALTAPLDLVLDAEAMGSLPDQSGEGLDEGIAGLEAIEHDLSGRRKVLFERLDALAAEITCRYRDGEASVESLLEIAPTLPWVRDEFENRWRDVGEFIREQRRIGHLSLRKLSEMADVEPVPEPDRARAPSSVGRRAHARALRISAETLYVRAGSSTNPTRSTS